MKKRCWSFPVVVIIMLSSCGVSKFVPEGEQLYRRGVISIIDNGKDVTDNVFEELKLVLPAPNKKILGSRVGLRSYYKNQLGKSNLWNKLIFKRFGEEPVYISDIDVARIRNLIANRLENNGYFYPKISDTLDVNRGSLLFEIELDEPYILNEYIVDKDSLKIFDEIVGSMDNSVINKYQQFSLSKLKEERLRINAYLKDKGYYYFNPEFLVFEADTNQYNDKRYDLYLTLKENVPKKASIPYDLHSVNVHSNTIANMDSSQADTIRLQKINFIQKGNYFLPSKLDPHIEIRPSMRYSSTNSKTTSNRLSALDMYKYVNIQYNETQSRMNSDTLGVLDANIYLVPLSKQSIKAEIQVVSKSNSFAGPYVQVTHVNRNIFNGGEALNLSASVGYESNFLSGNIVGLRSVQYGLSVELAVPRIVAPIRKKKGFSYSVPSTRVKFGLSHQNRNNLYNLNSISGIVIYNWKSNSTTAHALELINSNIVNLSNETEVFNDLVANNTLLQKSFAQEFISGSNYTFTYSELDDLSSGSSWYFSSRIELAGNSLNLFSKKKSSKEKRFLFGLEYAQFAKLDMDIRHYIALGRKSSFITRFNGGLGLAYGNSEVLPFSKQFFVGGPYSIRAFRTRALGPGIYRSNDNTESFFDQSGDIKLELNLEYRFPIIPFLNGAIFIDAGNIWLKDENPNFPGGHFSSSFIRELGIGAGIGFRFSLQNLVIRMDLASPLHSPYLSGEEQIDFKLSNIVWNFAIGYPF